MLRSAGGTPILALNMGSSSLKFSLYLLSDEKETLLADGEAEGIGLPRGRLIARRGDETVQDLAGNFQKDGSAIRAIFGLIDRLELPGPAAVGHRIVHGGPDHVSPAAVDAELIRTLRSLVSFAPLHLPAEIREIEAVSRHFPDLPQVACFDTAFHRRMPETAQRLALPAGLWNEGVRRYGFHGLSYEYILDALGEAAEGRVIVAHLGNGASMAAVQGRRPMDTSMGFTPAGGFMMGTRSGDLDPGVILYLMKEKGYGHADLDRVVNRESGLLGVSGISPDMKTLLDRRADDPAADLAIGMFCYQVRKQIGAFAAVLGGLDTLVFTGGIGEHAAAVREEICRDLQFLGIDIDARLNGMHADTISRPAALVAVRVIPTKEDLVIARLAKTVAAPRAAR